MAKMTKEEAVRFLRDFERDHPGETRRILETLWDLQGRAPGTFVSLDALWEALNPEFYCLTCQKHVPLTHWMDGHPVYQRLERSEPDSDSARRTETERKGELNGNE